MKRICLFAICLLFSAALIAQKRNALVIGIDTYTPPVGTKVAGARTIFNNLDGCKNDAMAMKSLIQNKFGFDKANVDSLFNRNATRANILAKFASLLARSNAGDVAFIYYAGHGSQQVNSFSAEEDKMDESIVPSDTWKPGVGDIRDKELAKIFNDFIDKGVMLTVIMDCCHSGSMSRGNTPEYEKPKTRYIAKNNFDAKDASAPQAPELRKEGTFLIISAAQDDELAEEQKDDRGKPHGAFTIALTEAINQQSVNASAINIFKSIGVILKNNGKKQEPVLAGSIERQNQTLFGIARGALSDKTLIPVSSIKNGTVELQGGFAEGLYKWHELTLSTDTNVVLRIDSVIGINLATAKIIKGTPAKVKVGQLFEISNWVSSTAPLLKIFIPEHPFTAADITKHATLAAKLRTSKGAKWFNDYQKSDPDVSLYFLGNKLMMRNTNSPEARVVTPEFSVLEKETNQASVFFNLPASQEFAAAIQRVFGKNGAIKIVKNASEAHYIVYGTVNDTGKPAYGFLRSQATSKDSLESMPLQTKNFVIEEPTAEAHLNAANELMDIAKKLAKVRAWMTLKPPVDEDNKFPFSLQLYNENTKKVVTTSEYKVGDRISLQLEADSNFSTLPFVTTKFIYVFAIDRDGAMTLLYPNARSGNLESKFPKDNVTTTVKLGTTFRISEPVGTDNYYLIATETPIPGYATLFNQSGTRGLPGTRNVKNPLSNLLNLGNEGGIGTRGPTLETPSTWNMQRKSMKSSH